MIGYNTTMEADGEGSFLYRFFPSPMLLPGQYQISLTAFYSIDVRPPPYPPPCFHPLTHSPCPRAQDRIFATTFFNDTMTVPEEEFSAMSTDLCVGSLSLSSLRIGWHTV